MHLQYSNTVPLRLTVYANRICSQCDVLWQFRLRVINFSLPWYAATICFVLTQFWPPETRSWNLYQLFFFSVHYSSHEDLISVCFYIYVKCACVLLCKYTHVLLFPSTSITLSLVLPDTLARGNTDVGVLQKASCSHSHLMYFPHTWLCINFRLIPSSVTCRRPPSPVFISCTGNSPPNSGPVIC